MKWHSIETAPKDGSEILIVCDNSIFIGHWDNCWCVPLTKDRSYLWVLERPTVWMPLPELP